MLSRCKTWPIVMGETACGCQTNSETKAAIRAVSFSAGFVETRSGSVLIVQVNNSTEALELQRPQQTVA